MAGVSERDDDLTRELLFLRQLRQSIALWEHTVRIWKRTAILAFVSGFSFGIMTVELMRLLG